MLRRPRRNRRTAQVRRLVAETSLDVSDLIQPLFVKEDGASEPIASLPGIERVPIAELPAQCVRLADLGLPAIALFPRVDPARKDACGSYALDPGNLLCRAVEAVKSARPDLLVITDVALDPYTNHGHDGLLDPRTGEVVNDATVDVLCRLALLQARAGADWVAPSDMMDGRVRAIREALDAGGFEHTSILAYSAKFASAFYGPFRDAIGSGPSAGAHYVDKRGYQLDPANRREAMLEARLDEEEGADILMVKPAGPYLDIIRSLRDRTDLPLAAYQVSGEYAQIHAAAANGWIDLEGAMWESLVAIRRAGADMILTYFAAAMAELFARRARPAAD